jgi:hypothetical protein
MGKRIMAKPKDQSSDDFDDFELFSDPDFDPDGFIQAMDDGSVVSAEPKGSVRERLEARREARWLREQLSDWDDWND